MLWMTEGTLDDQERLRMTGRMLWMTEGTLDDQERLRMTVNHISAARDTGATDNGVLSPCR